MNDFSQCSMGVGAVMKTTVKFRMGQDMGYEEGFNTRL